MSKALERKLAEAETYSEWCEAAKALDQRSGVETRREEPPLRLLLYSSTP